MIIPIVFAINDVYVKYFLILAVSILENSKGSEYEFNILHKDISEKNQDIIREFIVSKGSKVNFINMNSAILNLNMEKYLNDDIEFNHITVEAFFRYFIPELFPQYNKVIYLDSDILVLNDLKSLYETDITNYSLAAISDRFIQKVLKTKMSSFPNENMTVDKYFETKLHKKTKDYFNSGVLLLNSDKMRRENALQKLLDFTIKNSPLIFPDQDALNGVFENDVKYLDNKYNGFRIKDKELDIVHFVGGQKPWNYSLENNKYFETYWYYASHSPFWKNDLENVYNELKMKIFEIKIFKIIIFKYVQCKQYTKFQFLFLKHKIKHKLT